MVDHDEITTPHTLGPSSRPKWRDLQSDTGKHGTERERSHPFLACLVSNWRSLHFGRDDGRNTPHEAMFSRSPPHRCTTGRSTWLGRSASWKICWSATTV